VIKLLLMFSILSILNPTSSFIIYIYIYKEDKILLSGNFDEIITYLRPDITGSLNANIINNITFMLFISFIKKGCIA